MVKPEWLYFGCKDPQQAGHHLYAQDMCPPHKHWAALTSFDGMLAPQDTQEPFVGVMTRLGGWGLTALAFWDPTGDKRPGSNSIIFAPTLTCDGRTLLMGAQRFFPTVYDRWPGITVRASA